MDDSGLKAVKIAQENGCWDKADLPPKDYSLEDFSKLLVKYPKAFENYQSMSPSVQKTYAFSYYTLKTETARNRRLNVIVSRLELNLKPMDPLPL